MYKQGNTRRSIQWAALVLAAAIPLATLTPRAQLSDKTYPIKIDRPVKVGAKCDITASSSEKTDKLIKVGDKPPHKVNKSVKFELQGKIEVLAVDKEGNPTKISCTIQKLTKSENDGDSTDLLPAGSVVTADATGEDKKTDYSLKDGDLSEEQSKALGSVLEVHEPDAPSNDAMFGSNDPQKVGATWHCDQQKMADSLTKKGLPVDKDKIKGSTTRAEITTLNGQEAMKLNSTVEAGIDVPNLPPGVTATTSKFSIKISYIAPTDPAGNDQKSAADVQVEIVAQGKADGNDLDLHDTETMHRESTIVTQK